MKNILALVYVVFTLVMSGCLTKNTGVIKTYNGVEIHSEGLNTRVTFYNNDIVRIIKWTPDGSDNKLSLSVIKNHLPNLNLSVSDKYDQVVLRSSELQVKINKENLTVEYSTINNNVLLKEKDLPEFKPVCFDNDSGFSIKQKFRLTEDEGVYGLGQHQDGYFNYRNKIVELMQSNTNAVSSFLVSTKKYGILWDNYSKTVFEDNSEETSIWSDIGNNIDYYFVTGKNMDEIIAGYRELTGKAPMYGKHAYGYWQSKEHYDTQAELMSVARKYRELKIPIDNMIQDWDYWNGAQNWSGMFFDKTLFPKPKQMCDELHKMNYRIVISIWPALGPNTAIYKDMLSNGFLYSPKGWAGFKYYDAYNPEANKLYWKYLRDGIYSKGLDGWWIDSTEPDVVNAMTKHSSEYELKKMGSNFLGSFARYLNTFSLVMTDDLYKFWREETSDRRAYILTRSTFSGQQRNAATTWSGDIGASWEVYRNQISAGLNHCMSGIPYWTFDIGAFVLGAYDGVFMEGGKDPAYQELYARMFQFGAFSPIFRSHGSETPREIWEMGEFVEPILKINNLRYRLMPYIYSIAWKVTSDDYTIMRGLPMDFSYDENTYSISDQFMFGPSIMVSPVTRFMYHHPPETSELISSEHFKTDDGHQGLYAKYYKDSERNILSREQIDPNINILWYTGRPDYATDSMYAVTWKGKIIPEESGLHQFHLLCYDNKRLILDGDTLEMVYTSVEQYTEKINLESGKQYDFILETENRSTGAARMILNWKTPSMFAKEKSKVEVDKTRQVYLPKNNLWYDFWTGKKFEGGKAITAEAPINILPLFVKSGSIIPMGPFLQYTTEKPADPIELRIYAGEDGSFNLYEDENDNYNYEKGIYAIIRFEWNDIERTLTINDRIGSFQGMLNNRIFEIVIVDEDSGHGLELSRQADKTVEYNGTKQIIKF
ncbi:MAG: DUF5110 domain-containing protein [Melioribacteraceae bacterium]|nr:DUF5110 domain-containing protein [Melioribacteraceae bacterium]